MLAALNKIIAVIPANTFLRVGLIPEFNAEVLLQDPRFPACLVVQTDEQHDPVNAKLVTGRCDIIIVDTVKVDAVGQADTSRVSTLSDAVSAAMNYLSYDTPLLYAAIDSASGVSAAYNVGGMHLAMKTLQVEYGAVL
jgi:hypothetical protein